MAETTVIKEFLVALGYKQDEASLKKFETGITQATKAVIGLAGAVEGTAVLVAAGVARFASNLEALFFAAKRVGSSVADLKAFDLAAQDFGTTAGEALASIESLAQAMRVNPGNVSFINSLLGQVGESAYGANGHLRDTTDLMLGLAKLFQKEKSSGQLYLAEQYAQMFGISEHTMLAMANGDFGRDVAQKRTQYAGSGIEQAAKDAHAFETQLRELSVYVQSFAYQVQDALEKRLGLSLKDIEHWLKTNGPMVADRLVDAVNQIITVAEWLGQKFAWLIGELTSLDSETDGWSTKLILLGVALQAIGAPAIIGGILRLAGAFGTRNVAAAATAAAITGAYAAYKAFRGESADNWMNKLIPQSADNKIGEFIARMLSGISPTASKAFRANNPAAWEKMQQKGITSFLGLLGWTPSQASGILANLQAESGLDPNKPGDHGAAYGLGQWHKPFWDLFKKWSGGTDIHNSSRDQQLQFLTWDLTKGPDAGTGDLMRAAQNAAAVASIMSRLYERPAAGVLAANQRAAQAAHIDARQTTTISVVGTADAAATARSVADQQRKVNADLVRNLASVQ